MERIETDVGLQLCQHLGDITTDIEFRDLETFLTQRLGATLAGNEAHGTLGRPTAHQHRDVLLRAHVWPPRLPMRLISHSSSTPVAAVTLARTSSPNSSL